MVLIVLLCACETKKEAIDDDKFKEIMSGEGFSVIDVGEQFEQYGFFESVSVALEGNSNYQIEFYELDEDAISFYNTNKKSLNHLKLDHHLMQM